MAGKINTAIIGCGGFGNFHLDNLLKYKDVKVSALVSTDEKKLNDTLKKAPDARGYLSFEEMIKKEKVDCAFVCVTPNKHFNIENECAKNGIHLYVEKPLCLSYEQALQTSQIIEKSGIICSVGYHERYNPVIDQIKNYIKNNPPLLVSGKWIDFLPPPLWWRDKTKSGGQIVEQTTHIFDILRYIFGEGKVIGASAKKGIISVDNYNTDDASIVMIEFDCGVIASVSSACYLQQGARADIGFEIICPQIKIKYDWGKGVKYISNDCDQKVDFKDDFHYIAVDHFLKAVKENDKSLIKSSYQDALKTFKLTLDAEKIIER